mgnify:CR=1 FL=1
MLALSKHLYIVDDLKWSFMDAILNNRIKESIFWITEYYESGYKKETWQLLYVVFSCFYFKNYSYYLNKLDKKYKIWSKDNNFEHVLNITYRFSKMNKKDFNFFKIFWHGLKCKFCNEKGGLLNILLKILDNKKYRNVWFFINYNFEKTLKIVSKFYNTNFVFKNTDINDKKVQLFMFIYLLNNGKTKSKPNIKITKELKNFYESIIKDENKTYEILKYKRLYGIPKEIGCFNLERFNYKHKNIVNNYFNNWEFMANKSEIWKGRIEECFGKVDMNKINFPNSELEEKFYDKYNLEPDEQNLETHNKSICEIEKYNLTEWIKSFKN